MNCPHCNFTLSHTRVYLVNGVTKCGNCRSVITGFAPDRQLRNYTKTTVIRNPSTGEVRIPGRTDRPIHPKLQSMGFTEYSTIDTGRDMINFERSQNVVHEGSNYNNSGQAERDTGAI